MIELVNEMVGAFRAGTPYHPHSDELALEPEDGTVETTVRNLDKLYHSGKPIFGIIVENGKVLVIFKNGESYYARGFTVGRDSPGVGALARFLVDHSDGDWTTQYNEMYEMIATWTLAGPIPLPPPTEADFDRSRQWKPPA